MTLEQLEQELPNGLHDAQILSIKRSFEEESLILEVRILVGLPDNPPETRSEYRKAVITFTGVKLFIVESPDASSAFLAPGGVWFSAGRSEPGTFSPELEEKLGFSADSYSLFILDWQSSIHIAASDVSFAWNPDSTFQKERPL
ncbi:MAG: hypothetical protein WCF30_19930 [Terracidiphilus sp.]